MSQSPADPTHEALDFERAQPIGEATSLRCKACDQDIAATHSTYYGVNGNFVCPGCHEQLVRAQGSGGSFFVALAYGSGAAVLGAALYYGIAALTGYELGLVAIVVGIGVGKAVRMGAAARAGFHYRALALLLTYLSITATYVPMVMKGQESDQVLPAVIVAIILPVLMLMSFENIMGLIILGIGLWEAFKLSAPPSLELEGPFPVTAAPAQIGALETVASADAQAVTRIAAS